MDIYWEIKNLITELNKSKSIQSFNESKNKSKRIFWEQQAHDMQINKSILDCNVKPFLLKLSEYLSDIEAITNENEHLKRKNKYLEKQLEVVEKNLKISKNRNKKNKENTSTPYSSNTNHARGGCKLTDKQIERLLLIYGKRGKYSNMTLNQAIKEVAQTKNTYYKVIKLDYKSQQTRNRIKKIAHKNNITLNHSIH